jgi:hypothetical protein
MKDRFFALCTVFLIVSAALAFTACGLHYAPPETLEDLETARREAIETNYAASFKTRNKIYRPLSYGELVVVKPNSYMKLDSLYARKYALGQIGSDTEEVDARIEEQLAVVHNDTNPVLYVETHWFELKQDSTYEFIVDQISLDKANRIKDVEQLDYFVSPPSLVVFARKYMLEEGFTGYAMETTDQEIEFYTTYKEKAAVLSGGQKQDFIEHTLRIMQLASNGSTLSVEYLLKKLTEERIRKGNYPDMNLSAQVFNVERVMEERNGNDEFLYYRIKVLTPGSDKAPLEFLYDYYLQEL